MPWFLNDGRSQQGPLDDAHVVHLIATGQLAQGHIAAPGSGQWLPLESHPPFAQALHTARGGALAGSPQAWGNTNPQQSAGPHNAHLHPGATFPQHGLPQAGFAQQPFAPPHLRGAPQARKKSPVVGILLGLCGLFVVSVVGYVVFARKSRSTYYDLSSKLKVTSTKTTLKGDKLVISVSLSVPKKLTDFEVEPSTDWSTRVTAKESKPKPNKKGVLKLQFEADRKSFPAGTKTKLQLMVQAKNPDDDDGSVFSQIAVDVEPARSLANDNEGDLDCGYSCRVTITSAGDIEYQLPTDASATIDGKSIHGSGKQALDILPKLSTTSLAKGTAVDLPVSITFNQGKPLTGKLSLAGDRVDKLLLAHIRSHQGTAISLGARDSAPSRPRTVIFESEIYGDWSSYDMLDLIAKRETVQRSAGSCGQFRNTTTGEIKTVSRITYNHVYTVYDRRTGSVRSTREIRASAPACPETMSAKYDSVSNEADSEEGVKYLKSLVGAS